MALPDRFVGRLDERGDRPQQRERVLGRQVAAQRALALARLHELGDQRAELGAHGLRGRGVPRAVPLHPVIGQHAREAARERGEAILLGDLVAHRLREQQPPLEERVRDRLDQRLARREVPVDGADADPGATRDVLHAERGAVPRVLVERRLEHAPAIADGVDALPAQRTCSPIARPASAGDITPGSTAMVSNSCPSVGDARFARAGTNSAATPANARATRGR